MKNTISRYFALALLVCFSSTLFAQRNPDYEAYIATWHDLAAEQEMLYGIPASITLAQALLESAAGTSELAVNAKNHFGIKCTNDWRSDCYTHDDEKAQESFRVYRSAAQSFADHAAFLQRDRYKACFSIPVSDYRGWAECLRRCGYATDPGYADKLCRIIEDYNLAGTAPVDETTPVTFTPGTSTTTTYTTIPASAAPIVEQSAAAPALVAPAASVVAAPALVAPAASVVAEPASAPVVDEPATVAPAVVAEPIVDGDPFSAHEEKSLFRKSHFRGEEQSGAHYYLAREEDTYANVAFRLNVRERDLRKWNNALGRRMCANDHIYYSAMQANREKRWIRKQERLARKQAKAQAK